MKCHRLKGTAGPTCMNFFTELKKDKAKKASKIQFLEMEGSGGLPGGVRQQPGQPSVPPEVVIPEVALPSSDEGDFTEVLHIWLYSCFSF
jgi:hypothetical protein